MRLRARATIYLGVVLAGQLLLLAGMSYMLFLSNRFALEADRSRMILFESARLGGQLADGARNLGAYMVTKSVESEKLYKRSTEQFLQGMHRLAKLTENKPEDKKLVDCAVYDAGELCATFEQVKKLMEAAPNPVLLPKRQRDRLRILSAEGGPTIINRLRTELRQLAEKHQQDTDAARARSTRQLLYGFIAVAAIINLGGSFFLIAAFTNYITKRLNVLRDNTERLLNGQPLNDFVSGADEITELDRFFHKTAAIVQAATDRNKLVLSGMPAGVVALGDDATIKFANQAFQSLCGFSLAELTGKRFSSIVPAEKIEQFVLDLFADPGSMDGRVVNCRIACKDGSFRYGESSFATYSDDAQTVVVCSILDVSARREIEVMKQEFVNIVSHDLRTPLGSILSASRLIFRQSGDELSSTGKEQLELVVSECANLLKLVTDLLTISKLESGKYLFDLTRESVDRLLENAIGAVREQTDKKEISIEVDDVDYCVAVDAIKVHEVLTTILSQAIKSSEEGGTIRVRCTAQDDRIVLRIRDSGPAVDEHFRNTLSRSDGLISVVTHRAMLHIAIAKLIIEAHNGALYLNSTITRGNEFVIELPALSVDIIAGTT